MTSFTKSSLKFLRDLKRNNDREWFEKRKPQYETSLKTPMLALIEEINHDLAKFAPEHVRPPQKAMMRIYRDIRFSKNKLPYKTNVAAWWSRTGLEKTSGGGFYFQLDATSITIAAGVYMPERDQLLAIRQFLAASGGNHHDELRHLLADRKLLRVMHPFDPEAGEGKRLTRAPKGFSPDDPALDLLLCRQWGVSATLAATEAIRPTLSKQVIDRFKRAAPLIAFLNTPLLGKPAGLNTSVNSALFGLPKGK